MSMICSSVYGGKCNKNKLSSIIYCRHVIILEWHMMWILIVAILKGLSRPF